MATRAPATVAAEIPDVAERQSPWLAVADFCRRRPLGAIGAFIVLGNLFVAVFANLLSPYDPLATDYGAMLAAPSLAHWLGTDAFGRDVLSRILFGSRTAMLVGFSCAMVGGTLGTLIGVAGGLFGWEGGCHVVRVVVL